jgi:hypothetical protein
VLQRKVVEARLLDLGFTTGEVKQRLADLSDAQVRVLAMQVEDLKAGGTAEGFIIGLALIFVLLGLVLPLFGIRVWR